MMVTACCRNSCRHGYKQAQYPKGETNMGKSVKEKKTEQKKLKKSIGYLRKGAKNLAK
jgi:hypothetical protein